MGKKKRSIPIFNKPLIETHCHLDYLKQGTPDEIVRSSAQYGIEKIITISVSPDNLEMALQVAQSNQNVWCTQGVHPHDARLYDDHAEKIILKNILQKEVLAIGEIGLDYHYDNSPRERQREVFERQIQIACKHDLPIVVHTREAEQDTMDLLAKYASKLTRKGVIHSFTSSEAPARRALELGFYLGFNGIITFNSAENVRDIVRMCPLNRILLETDAPFLTPVPYRGRENAPIYLPFVAEKVAEVKGVGISELLDQTYQNSFALFQFS